MRSMHWKIGVKTYLRTASSLSLTAAVLAPNKQGNVAVFPMIWGFTHESTPKPLINCRIETADQKPLWKEYDKWIRLDARGNKEGVNAQFGIDTEQLAFPIRSDKGEQDGYIVYPEPDREIVKALTSGKTRTELWNELPMKLEYNMVCGIRKWRASDAGDLAAALSNRKVLDNLRDGLPYPYTENDAADFIETMLSADPDSTFAFAITVDDKAIGSIGVFRQGNIHRLTAEMGYYISEEYWGNGIMTDVVLQTCDYVFSNSDIIRIYAEPFAHNAASCRVLEKAGFQFEGVLRSNAVKNGRIIDMKMYSKIKGEQQMNIISSIDSTRKGFEESFASGEFYNRQTDTGQRTPEKDNSVYRHQRRNEDTRPRHRKRLSCFPDCKGECRL